MTSDCLLGKVETSHHFEILSIILILMLAYSQPEKYAFLLCILIHNHMLKCCVLWMLLELLCMFVGSVQVSICEAYFHAPGEDTLTFVVKYNE